MKKQNYYILFSLCAIICMTIVIVDLLDDGQSRFLNEAGHNVDARAAAVAKEEYRHFSVLELGSSYQAAQNILHASGRLLHTNTIGDVKQCTYSWSKDEIKITCSFRNDKLYSKSINGFDVCNLWSESGGIKIDHALFNQVQIGMTYPQVAKLFGNKGLLVSESVDNDKQLTELFSWENKQHERINIVFIDGEVAHKGHFGLQDKTDAK